MVQLRSFFLFFFLSFTQSLLHPLCVISFPCVSVSFVLPSWSSAPSPLSHTTINIGFKLTLIHPSSPPSAQQQHPFPLLFFFHSSSLLFCDWCCYLAVELSLEWLIQLKPCCLHLSRQKKGAEPLVSSPWPLLLLLLLTVDNIEPQPANWFPRHQKLPRGPPSPAKPLLHFLPCLSRSSSQATAALSSLWATAAPPVSISIIINLRSYCCFDLCLLLLWNASGEAQLFFSSPTVLQ